MQPGTEAGGRGPAATAARSPLEALAQALHGHPQRRAIERSLVALLHIAREEQELEAWKLVSGALADLSEALQVFRPLRASRKISIFGSARTTPEEPCYQLAARAAQLAVAAGFEVMSGAGGGVMEAANRGAGCQHSFGLNIDLPFEQHSNPYLSDCEGRLLFFRYFFTRKLFFLRESDALLVLPGGFGTFDELFECLTLIQTGRTPPIPLVLLAPPSDPYWSRWQQIVHRRLVDRNLISPEDLALISRVSSAEAAVERIRRFYRVFHSARLDEQPMELLLHAPIPAPLLAQLNLAFADMLSEGSIHSGESVDENGLLHPCLQLRLDRRRVGRLYQFIDHINDLDLPATPALDRPGDRQACPSPEA
ncbi:MAG: LOG family protein [Synechococcus sp.]|nr:LOG family protein [Synechococcus sp.]